MTEVASGTSASFGQKRVVRPLRSLVLSGASPPRLAWSLGVGAALGILPIPGTTTILCGIAAAALRLNHPAIQIANYLVTPLHVALLYPFLRAGQWLFGAEPLPFSLEELRQLFATEGWTASRYLLAAELRAAVAWLPVALLIAPGVAGATRPFLERLRDALPKRRTPPVSGGGAP